MPDQEARDAVVSVEVDLPNGKGVSGHLIPWRKGLELKALLYRFSETMEQEDFDRLWARFEGQTGITERELQEKCPSLTLLELTDLISRFIYLLRPGRTAAQVSTGTPDATAAPPPGEPTAALPDSSPSAPALRRA